MVTHDGPLAYGRVIEVAVVGHLLIMNEHELRVLHVHHCVVELRRIGKLSIVLIIEVRQAQILPPCIIAGHLDGIARLKNYLHMSAVAVLVGPE